MSGSSAGEVQVIDCGVDRETFLADVLAGLSQEPKRLPPKYFYDRRGSELFDRICQVDEYYLTRTEAKILREQGSQIARQLGPGCVLFEPGSGSSEKVRLLLEHLDRPAAYVPIEISESHLRRAAARLKRDFPELAVLPVCADFLGSYQLPKLPKPHGRRVVFFPGSTLGNFEPPQAERFLERMAALAGPGGGVLLGLDLVKSPQRLVAAYNDQQGVTAAFNRNLLQRINRELGADFDLDQFAHRAFYNPVRQRIEMHLESLAEQVVTIDEHRIAFEAGESIHTENSYKYSLGSFARLARRAGLSVEHQWTDPQRLFSVQLLSVPQSG